MAGDSGGSLDMARPTLATHPKFHRLASLVGGRGAARGALELIWDCAYASGDPVIGDSVTVEAAADWRGTPGALTDALVSSGFLDVVHVDANGKHLQAFAVHDLEHHAPDYVLKRWEREAKRREAGETIRSIRQRAANASWHASVRRLQASVHTPAPAPAPRSDQIADPPPAAPKSPAPPAPTADPAAPVDSVPIVTKYPKAFLDVWERTGRHGSKFKGWKAWARAKCPPWSALSVPWASYMRTERAVAGFVKDLSTWLNERGWEQEWIPAGRKGDRTGPIDRPASPPAPKAPPPPRCSHHEKSPRFRNPHPVDWCPGCREQVAREGGRMMTTEELLQPPDWMALAKGGDT